MRRDDDGQAVVLLAISLPLVLALLLLVIDGGRLYVQRQRLHDAAQLAAEAGVSLAADSPGATPKPAEVRTLVRDALDRNLPGEPYVYSVAIPGRSAVPEYNVQVHVSEPFHASIAAVTFTIGAEAAARLGTGSSAKPPAGPPALPAPISPPRAAACFAYEGAKLTNANWTGAAWVDSNPATPRPFAPGSSHWLLAQYKGSGGWTFWIATSTFEVPTSGVVGQEYSVPIAQGVVELEGTASC